MNEIAGILVNLGAPDAPTAAAASAFLREFLSDKCVINLPWPLRFLIARKASKNRAQAYAQALEKIFVDGRHPMKSSMDALAEKVERLCGFPVRAAYRYGGKNISQTIVELKRLGAERFAVACMYPQSTLSTTHSAKLKIAEAMGRNRYALAREYFDNPLYIESLACGAARGCECLMVAFHSVPVSHDKDGQYRRQCSETARLLAQRLGARKLCVAYQSQMGKGTWIGPKADERAGELAAEGVKELTVSPASFACECSETIDELGGKLRGVFLESGGQRFNLLPCPGASDAAAKLAAQLLTQQASYL